MIVQEGERDTSLVVSERDLGFSTVFAGETGFVLGASGRGHDFGFDTVVSPV